MADNTPAIPSSLLLPIGPFTVGAGWSTVLTYPSLQRDWVFLQSPNNKYWGPSARLRTTLDAGEANIIEIPVTPAKTLTYAEGAAQGLSKGKVNNINGVEGEVLAGDLLQGPNGYNF